MLMVSIILVVFSAAEPAGPAESHDTRPRVKLVCNHPVHDVGTIWAGPDIEHEFIVRNEGTEGAWIRLYGYGWPQQTFFLDALGAHAINVRLNTRKLHKHFVKSATLKVIEPKHRTSPLCGLSTHKGNACPTCYPDALPLPIGGTTLRIVQDEAGTDAPAGPRTEAPRIVVESMPPRTEESSVDRDVEQVVLIRNETMRDPWISLRPYHVEHDLGYPFHIAAGTAVELWYRPLSDRPYPWVANRYTLTAVSPKVRTCPSCPDPFGGGEWCPACMCRSDEEPLDRWLRYSVRSVPAEWATFAEPSSTHSHDR